METIDTRRAADLLSSFFPSSPFLFHFRRKCADFRPIEPAIFRCRFTRSTTYRYPAAFDPVWFVYFNRGAEHSSDRSRSGLPPFSFLLFFFFFFIQACSAHLSFAKKRRSQPRRFISAWGWLRGAPHLRWQNRNLFPDVCLSKCPVNYLAAVEYLRPRLLLCFFFRFIEGCRGFSIPPDELSQHQMHVHAYTHTSLRWNSSSSSLERKFSSSDGYDDTSWLLKFRKTYRSKSG